MFYSHLHESSCPFASAGVKPPPSALELRAAEFEALYDNALREGLAITQDTALRAAVREYLAALQDMTKGYSASLFRQSTALAKLRTLTGNSTEAANAKTTL